MDSQDRELERFKTQINLLEYAVSEYGYEVDRAESSVSNAVLRASNDKICVNLSSNGHWIYWSPRNDSDSGTIIDFLQNRGVGSLGNVRQKLRPIVSSTIVLNNSTYIPKLKAFTEDRESVLKSYHRTKVNSYHPYLRNERHIPETTLGHPTFKGRIREDEYGNAIFPHYDSEGICGFSRKNKDFTGFSKNGRRGLWCSRAMSGNSLIVITESVIDALSYHALHKGFGGTFISIDGQLSTSQIELLRKLFEKLDDEKTVIVGMDNDYAGEKYFLQIERLFNETAPKQVTLKKDVPILKDWNEDLASESARFEHLRARLQEAADQADRGEFSDATPEQIMAEVKTKLEAKDKTLF